MVNDGLVSKIGETITKLGGGVTAEGIAERMEKLNTMSGLSYSTGYGQLNQPMPPYQRTFSPLWIYKIRRDSPLMNNAMRQKIWQTFRGGLSEWKKEYDAKCPACQHEFEGMDKFRQQMDADGEEVDLPGGGPMMNDGGMPMAGGPDAGPMAGDPMGGAMGPPDLDHDPNEEDIDLDEQRVCPECEEVVEMRTPDDDVKHHAQDYFDRANIRDPGDPMSYVALEPSEESAVSQSFIDVLEEIAWDIQSFDDGWLLFERSYVLDEEGHIVDWELENVMRGPPELMRWCIDEEQNEPGGEFYVCLRCRAEASAEEGYHAEEDEGRCPDCGNILYPAYAYATETPAGQGGQPDEFFIRGEFYKDSEYERKRYYGYPPVLTLWEESRTVEQMDQWYNDAYEERRAPRGALLVNAAHDQELRQMNRQQMEKMREDPNYIPLFMNDADEEGDPIKFVELLENPAEMQHMEMRDWFMDRISAHYGVTSILMSGSPENSGLSQSMEVEVSEKQAEHFRNVLNGFIDAFLAQIGTPGWTRELEEVKEDDPEKEAQLVGQHLNNAQKFLQMGGEAEWTPDDRVELKSGELEMPEEEGMMGGGPEGVGPMMGMEGGVQGPRGPEPDSLEPGQDPNAPGPEGEREREGPADDAEGPDSEDRPAATPLKSASADEKLEKIAATAFETPKRGEDVELEA
jgi:DNA-directed RNA polymerase subunit RPC12/RpoP